MGSYCLMGTDLLFKMIKEFWKCTVVMVAQHCGCTSYHWIIYLKLQMVCIFYHNKKKLYQKATNQRKSTESHWEQHKFSSMDIPNGQIFTFKHIFFQFLKKISCAIRLNSIPSPVLFPFSPNEFGVVVLIPHFYTFTFYVDIHKQYIIFKLIKWQSYSMYYYATSFSTQHHVLELWHIQIWFLHLKCCTIFHCGTIPPSIYSLYFWQTLFSHFSLLQQCWMDILLTASIGHLWECL